MTFSDKIIELFNQQKPEEALKLIKETEISAEEQQSILGIIEVSKRSEILKEVLKKQPVSQDILNNLSMSNDIVSHPEILKIVLEEKPTTIKRLLEQGKFK